MSIDSTDKEKDITFTIKQDVGGGELSSFGKTIRINVTMEIRCGTENVMEPTNIIEPLTIQKFKISSSVQKYEF